MTNGEYEVCFVTEVRHLGFLKTVVLAAILKIVMLSAYYFLPNDIHMELMGFLRDDILFSSGICFHSGI